MFKTLLLVKSYNVDDFFNPRDSSSKSSRQKCYDTFIKSDKYEKGFDYTLINETSKIDKETYYRIYKII